MTLSLSEEKLDFYIVRVFLVICFISDGLNKLMILITESINLSFSPSLVSRFFLEVIVIVMMLFFLNKKRADFIQALALLFFVFISGVMVYVVEYSYPYGLFFHISLFNKYVFAFLIYFFSYKLRDHTDLLNKLIRLVNLIFIINSIAIIIGFVLRIKFFRSYIFQDYRSGYSGFIPAVNEASLFYFIAISFVYYNRFVLGIKSRYDFIIIGASFLIGAKAIYFTLVGYIIFHFIKSSSFLTKIKTLILVGLLIFIGIPIFVKYGQEVLSYFLYLSETNGVISMLLSGRDEFLRTRVFENINYWSAYNYFAGGQDQTRFLIEMDIVDLFLFFGIVGSLLYIIMFFYSVFSFSLKRGYNLFFVSMYFGLAALGGHFFSSALNALYLVLFCLYIKVNDKIAIN